MMSAVKATRAEPLDFTNILVTGANGFVGRHFVPALRARLKPATRLCLATKDGVSADGDLSNRPFDLERPDTVTAALKGQQPDLIIHLAGQAAVGPTAGGARANWAVNFGGAAALANAVADYAPTCTVLFVSTVQVYGRAFERGPVDETTTPDPMSSYGRSKLAAEMVFGDVLPDTARLIIARPSNHIGPGQTLDFAAPAFAAQIAALELRGGGEVSVGNLEAERDLLSVEDVMTAYLSLLEVAAALPQRSLFNVASGQLVRMADVLDRLIAASSAKVSVVRDPNRYRPNDIQSAAVDSTRLRDLTRWHPTHTLDTTLLAVLDEQRALLTQR